VCCDHGMWQYRDGRITSWGILFWTIGRLSDCSRKGKALARRIGNTHQDRTASKKIDLAEPSSREQQVIYSIRNL
jgi:hypothetical protein